ncbi:hypothetical protein LAZ67_8000229 [Cordylochernes scorpioides]|uniref:Transposase n=1 Tax=Cordylochernes scorpioides TaxID=51811 RepID=A0ABY6KST6_9ARAC|nr:hypothetical protein LAZ67_8000229 [Cordylochernes scorpioides]
MRCLREAVRPKRPERWQNNDWILHVGNARPHTAHVVLQFLAKHSTIQIPHPPYSPDLAPNDFFLYPKLKMNLKGQKFDNVDMIQAESKATLRNLSKKELSSVTGQSVYLGIMRCLREAVRLKRPERWQNNDWILHVGNARPHTAHVVLQFLAKHSTIQIPHPPYSPDLAPNDFFLYPKLKINLKGRKFDNVDMIQAESKATLRNLSKSDFISCFDNWKKDGTGQHVFLSTSDGSFLLGNILAILSSIVLQTPNSSGDPGDDIGLLNRF